MQVVGVRASRAVFVGAASYLVLCASLAEAQAQSGQTLPPVTVDAPNARPSAARRATPTRQATARRAVPARVRTAQPTAPVATASGAREIGSGPVQGFVATQTASGTKTDTPIVEVPQSISVVPKDQITAQGAQSIAQALRYTPGVYSETNGAASFTSTFMRSRGFQTDLYLDGLRLPAAPSGAVYSEVEPYNVERIEVLKGPSSGLYGSSGPGGLVNMTSKRPLDTSFHEVALQTGSFNRKQVQFDFSDRFNGNPDALFRVVGLVRDSDTQFDYGQDKREFIAPSITLKSDDTKLTLLGSYFHSDQRANFFNMLPASATVLPNPNGRIGMNVYSGEPSYDRVKREQYTVGYAFEHHFNEAMAFRQNFRYVGVRNDVNSVGMGRGGSDPLANNDPRTGLQIGDTTLQNVRRGVLYTASDNSSLSVDNQFETKFVTGPFAHTAVLGLDYRTLDSTYIYTSGGTRTTLNVFNPTYGLAISDPTVAFNNDLYKLEQAGLYFQDQIKAGGWILTLGGRQDWASTKIDNKLGTAGPTGPRDSSFTGRAGLGYEFGNGVVPYVSYATSFEPVIGQSFNRTAFRPTTGEQLEGGVKWQPIGTRTLLTAAVFDITQQNVRTNDTQNPGFSVQTGEVKVKGFEFEARTELERLSVIAAYTFLDAKITKSNILGEVGNRPNQTPEHQASIWAQYGLGGHLEGLTLGGGIRYVGSTGGFQAAANYGGSIGFVPAYVLTAPAYTLVDAMASYDLKYLSQSLTGAKLQINATNLFNQYYIAGCGSIIQCYMGNGRQVLATLSYHW